MSFKILTEIGVALGKHRVDSDYFLNQLTGEEKERKRHFFEEIAGRNIRYLADETQTSLTLATEAAMKAIALNRVDINDIDMVICVSHTPEYVSPTMARLVYDALGGKKESVNCFDMNVNCTGMLVALDMADRYFRTDHELQKMLIVQGDKNSMIKTKVEADIWGLMSDIGCAVILERDETKGIINRYFALNSEATFGVVYPKDGYSKPNPILGTDTTVTIDVEEAVRKIEDKLGPQEMEEVKLMGISQFAHIVWQRFAYTQSSVTHDRIPYIGDVLGYTGASSPLLALHEGVKTSLIKRGDKVILWTFGAGCQQVMLELVY